MPAANTLFSTLAQQREAFMSLLATLPEDVLAQKGLIGEWSIKNILAHLTAWDLVVAQMLPDRLTTRAQPAILDAINADEDAWNAAQIAEGEELTPEDQLIEVEWARNVLVEYLRSLDEETLGRGNPWDGWDGTVAEYILTAVGDHEQEHVAAIQQALAARQP